MVERLVFVKLKDSALRDGIVAAAREAFPRIGVVTGFRAGTPADADAEVWDLVLAVQFASLDDVATYVDDPIHVSFVQTHLAPNAQVKKAWNFSV